MLINTWYLPSWYGDIRLDATDEGHTRVTFFKLSGAEVDAMKALRKTSVGRTRKWTTEEAWEKIPLRAFEQGDKAESVILLKGRIDKVEKVLTKALRPERAVLRVVRIGDGKIEEIRDRDFEEKKAEVKPEEPSTALAVPAHTKPAKKEPAAAATTVAAPVLGCPPPDFEDVHKRANRVLRTFLTPQQVYDFERRQQFIVVGGDTGHRYLLTSRNAPNELGSVGGRTVYDLDEKHSFCVHDWGIPAEEELLTMALFLQLPGRESYIREIPDPLNQGGGGFICGPMPC